MEGIKETGKRVEPGFSGGPVWDDELGGVVGMVVAADKDVVAKVAAMIPVSRLAQVLGLPMTPTLPAAANPFHTGGAVPPEKFVGRANALELIRSRFGGRTLQNLSMVGDRRIGKSSLLTYVCAQAAELWPTATPTVVYLDLMRGYCHTRKGWMTALRLELTTALKYAPWKDSDDGDLSALAFALDDLHRKGARVVLALDELEELTKRRAEFDDVLEELRGAGQMGKIGLLTASAHPLADLCRTGGLNSPFHNIFTQATLGLLTEPDWHALVRAGLPAATLDDLRAIERLAGGHPFYTALAASCLWETHGTSTNDWPAQAHADLVPHWEDLWTRCTTAEQNVLRAATGFAGQATQPALIDALRRRGVLHPTAFRPFSEAFAQWLSTR
jgi:hypothetical protein